MYPIPVLTRDIPGYRITPHTDTQWKGITVQLYLPRDASATHIGTIFHDRLPDGSLPKAMQMKFAPNTGYAFAVGDNTWHSADPVGNEVETPRQHPAHLFRRCRAAAHPAQPRQADRQFPAERGEARGAQIGRLSRRPGRSSRNACRRRQVSAEIYCPFSRGWRTARRNPFLNPFRPCPYVQACPAGKSVKPDLRRAGVPQGPRKVAITGL